MRLATIRHVADGAPPAGDATCAAVRVAGGYALLPHADVATLLRSPDGLALAAAAVTAGTPDVADGAASYAPLLVSPVKVLCAGLNYADHIAETGRERPAYPTLFAKFADTFTGATDPITLPPSADQVDWEAELAVVVGAELRDADEDEARAAIAGYTIANDVSMRDWQRRTLQWLQGKAFDATTPLGPELVTPDEFDPASGAAIGCAVNGAVTQSSDTAQLVFTPAALLAYISTFTVLRPGDVVLTGTPGGVGLAATPPRFLAAGDLLETTVQGIGTLRNRIVAPRGRVSP